MNRAMAKTIKLENDDVELYKRILDIQPALVQYRIRHQMDPLRYPMTPQISTLYRASLDLFNKTITIYLTPSYTLYINPKSRYSYELRKSKYRLKIIQTLMNQSNFISTEALRQFAGYKNTETLYKTIFTLNTELKKRLGLAHNLIEGKSGSGYWINSKYCIVPTTK